MTAIADFFENVPQPLQWGLAGVGALFLGSKILSYLQLVLSAFVLGGTNVSVSACQLKFPRLRLL
jgi:17beta-estradiol 17-dehydrogenase / very-long-chain 3-oxoacyl-CoA reductase